MTHIIEKDESVANQRTFHFRLFTSDGTSPDTSASGDSVIVARGSTTTFTPDVQIAAVHAAQGMYSVILSASNVSNLGTHSIYHTQGSFPQEIVRFDVVNFNPYSTWSNAAVKTHSGVTFGSLATIATSGIVTASYTAGTYSGVTFGSLATIATGGIVAASFGAGAIDAAAIATDAIGSAELADSAASEIARHVWDDLRSDYSTSGTFGQFVNSNVTVWLGSAVNALVSGRVDADASAVSVGLKAVTHSGATVGSAATILAGTYSGVTLGINNIAAGNYSGVTISGVTTTNNLDKTDYNVASLDAGVITTASIAAAAFDSTVFATNAEQAFADRLLLRSIAGGADSGRTVGTALYVLRNKVDASSSVGTVYQVDDSTSAFTFSNTTGAFPISSVDP